MDKLIAVLEDAERQCLDECRRSCNSAHAGSAPPWIYKAEGIRFSINTAKALMEGE